MTLLSHSEQSNMTTYLPLESVEAMVEPIIRAGDALADLLKEPLATEDEIEEAVRGWERATAKAKRS